MGRTSDARERLIAAAIELLWHYGYGSVSVDALCAHADVRKGSFYHFFPSKDDLVVAALGAHWAGRREVLATIFAPAQPPLIRFADFFDYVVARQRQLKKGAGRILGCFHASIGSECIRQNPAIAAKVQEILTEYRGILQQSLEDAAAEGLLEGRAPAALAKALFSFLEGALGQARIHDDIKHVEALRTTGWQILGLASPRPAPAAKSLPGRRPAGRPSGLPSGLPSGRAPRRHLKRALKRHAA